MAKYLIQDTTLTNIANAIREKTGNTSTLFPENMPSHIRSIQTTESDTTGIPDDIVAEAKRVASGMISKMGAHSLTFIAMSDMHEYADEDHSDANIIERGRRANRNAGQAAKLIADKVPLDFFANLGDFATGGSATTITGGVKCIRRTREYIADVALAHESFMTPGNHDSLAYSYSTTGECLSYDILTGLIGTYRYVDFDSKKVRVICLNTSDNNGDLTAKERISGNQLQWFCEALDLSAKSDASEWGIVVLSHHPLDWGAIKPAANVLAAYLEGGNYSATHNSVAVSYNFNGKNAAQVIAQFHGHVHGFKVDYINDFRGGTKVATAVQRVAIPNASFYRNNEYGENGKTEYDGIEFGEDTTYNKSDDSTGNNTAFCLVSIDLENKVIYADCFGAGYDRIISYAPEEIITYTITNNLTNVNNNNSATSVVDGSTYSAVLQADSTYEIESVLITMGGADVTASVWNGSVISIGNVTGDIVITASATYVGDGTYTNLVTTSVNPSDGATIYNSPYGYKDGAYVRGSADGTNENMVSTGAILMTDGVESVYIRGATWDETSNYVRFYVGDIGSLNSYVIKADGSGSNQLSEFFTVETLGDNYYKWTLTSKGKNILYGRYYRISLVGAGENLVITYDEPIPEDAGGSTETKNYTVTNTLTNVTSSNSAASVTEGATYTATLTANTGYTLDTVTVTMGGTDITSSAYSNGNIGISNVTGNIVITATASASGAVAYTNLVPTSEEDSSTNIYNGVGYKEGVYCSSSGGDGADASFVATGNIPYTWTKGNSLYIKGADVTTASHIRIYGYATKGTSPTGSSFAGGSNLSIYFTLEQLGDHYYKLTHLTTVAAVKYLRLSLVKVGGQVPIVTLNEPIE